MRAATQDAVHCRAQVSREVHVQTLFLNRGRCAHGAIPVSHIKFLFVLGKAANLEGGEGGGKEDEGKSSKRSRRACCPDPPAKGWESQHPEVSSAAQAGGHHSYYCSVQITGLHWERDFFV